MQATLEHKILSVTANLEDGLKSIEQQCQTLRWRLENFDQARSIRQLEAEVRGLAGDAIQAAVNFGRISCLAILPNCDSDPIPFDRAVEGFTKPESISNGSKDAESAARPADQGSPLSGQAPAGTSSVAATYHVIQLLGDTEIVEAHGGGGEYPTFGAAKAAAIDYLESVIEMCEMTIDEIRDADSPERYFGTEEETTPEADGVVQII